MAKISNQWVVKNPYSLEDFRDILLDPRAVYTAELEAPRYFGPEFGLVNNPVSTAVPIHVAVAAALANGIDVEDLRDVIGELLDKYRDILSRRLL